MVSVWCSVSADQEEDYGLLISNKQSLCYNIRLHRCRSVCVRHTTCESLTDGHSNDREMTDVVSSDSDDK